MKKVLIVLVLGVINCNLYAQTGVGGTATDILYNPDYKDTNRAYLQGNLGASYFKNYSDLAADFNSSIQYDIKLMFKFIKDPKFLNGAIGVQFSETSFILQNQYANISDNEITLEPLTLGNIIYNRIKIWSINTPIMLNFRARDVSVLNKFKFGVGIVPGFNLPIGLQKTKYTIGLKKYMLRERSNFDMSTFRGSFLFEISFNNFTFYYEHGINTPGASHNFTTGVNKLGVGFSL
jgi:hypothetical protein